MTKRIKYANIEAWCDVTRAIKHKMPQPILTFPAAQLLGLPVQRLVTDPISQAMGIKLITDRYDLRIAMGYMDLSTEAEAFGAQCHYSDEEVPTIVGTLIEDEEDADNLVVPEVGAGRTGTYVQGIEMALQLIEDRPVFGNCIGPYSLAGRLVNVNEAMILCYEEPEMMHTVLQKCTEFIIKYAKAYKEIGAHGILMAEPLAGILSPHLAEEFSAQYVRQIVEAVQDENFVFFYHNCGNEVVAQAESIFTNGCKGFHFGDKADIKKLLEIAPKNLIIMGNVSPSEQFYGGTEASMRAATYTLMHECSGHDNFWLSSGCDIPPMADFRLVDVFFDAARVFYDCNNMYEKLNKMLEKKQQA